MTITGLKKQFSFTVHLVRLPYLQAHFSVVNGHCYLLHSISANQQTLDQMLQNHVITFKSLSVICICKSFIS